MGLQWYHYSFVFRFYQFSITEISLSNFFPILSCFPFFSWVYLISTSTAFSNAFHTWVFVFPAQTAAVSLSSLMLRQLSLDFVLFQPDSGPTQHFVSFTGVLGLLCCCDDQLQPMSGHKFFFTKVCLIFSSLFPGWRLCHDVLALMWTSTFLTFKCIGVT